MERRAVDPRVRTRNDRLGLVGKLAALARPQRKRRKKPNLRAVGYLMQALQEFSWQEELRARQQKAVEAES
jgi:hypothetical protein